MPTESDEPNRRPSNTVLNLIAIAVGIATFAIGAAWVIYRYLVDREAPYFAIPLVFSVPVIVAVTVRSLWD